MQKHRSDLLSASRSFSPVTASIASACSAMTLGFLISLYAVALPANAELTKTAEKSTPMAPSNAPASGRAKLPAIPIEKKAGQVKPLQGANEPLRARRAVLAVTVSPRRVQGGGPWFRSIGEALDYAARQSAATVKVTVRPGQYTGRLSITRPTIIESTDPRPHAVVLHGSISNGQGHSLTISGLEIRDASPYGLIQRGGELRLRDVRIHGTRRVPNDWHSGVGLDVGGGVSARLNNVVLEANQGTALRVHGQGTEVVAFGLQVTGNNVHPAAVRRAWQLWNDEGESGSETEQGTAGGPAGAMTLPRRSPKAGGLRHGPDAGGMTERALQRIDTSFWENVSAVEVRENALLLAESPVIDDNQHMGMVVEERGRVHLRGGRIAGTREVTIETSSWPGHADIGTDLEIYGRSRVELRNMEISRANWGIGLVNSWLQATDVTVRDNGSGIYFGASPAANYNALDCWARRGSNNRAFDNGRNASFAGDLPLPDLGLGEYTPPANCPGVPWSYR
jgi:hypothetical protein